MNHVWGTSSESAHFWDHKTITTVRERGYKWGWYLQYYIYIKMYQMCSLKSAQTGNAVKTLKVLRDTDVHYSWNGRIRYTSGRCGLSIT